ncbi:hypothetical protein BDZ45DRAFT_694593 [Acephala macrosclerotiorum]|nr:hypothetical protein BDZ45DRAFT_694593 [Acephala macrosclerotiorum]
MANIQCSASKRRGVPLELLKHGEIEEVLRLAKRRWGKRHRRVYLVTIAAGTTWVNTNGLFRWALHWALKIGDTYFELDRTRNDGKFTFTKQKWSAERIRLSTSSLIGGTTYLEDDEILGIGLHYVKCWNVFYSLTLNNCQKLIIAVLSCILPGELDIKKHWVAHQYCSMMARASSIILRPAIDILGCPKEISQQYRLALLNYYLELIDLEGSKRFNNYKDQYKKLTERFPRRVDPIKSWLQKIYLRASIGTYSIAARYRALTRFPVIVKVGGGTCAVKTCQDIDASGVQKTQAALRRIALILAAKYHESTARDTTGLEDLIKIFKGILHGETTLEIMPDNDILKELDAILEDLDNETWADTKGESEANESPTQFAVRAGGMILSTFFIVVFIAFFISLFSP